MEFIEWLAGMIPSDEEIRRMEASKEVDTDD
jgi:hypothetical protein